MLTCYLDDSGNDQDPIVTLAGYVSPEQNWRDFETEARAAFDIINLPYLHTMDLHGLRREFADWTRADAAKFAKLFHGILDQHVYAGFEFSVVKSTFEARKTDYDVEHQSSPVGFCLHDLVSRLVRDEKIRACLNSPEVNLSFVIESGNKNEGDMRRRFNNIQKQDPDRFGSISFVPKQARIALQAAGFLAYFCRRLRTKNRAHPRYKDEMAFFTSATNNMLQYPFLATDFMGRPATGTAGVFQWSRTFLDLAGTACEARSIPR